MIRTIPYGAVNKWVAGTLGGRVRKLWRPRPPFFRPAKSMRPWRLDRYFVPEKSPSHLSISQQITSVTCRSMTNFLISQDRVSSLAAGFVSSWINREIRGYRSLRWTPVPRCVCSCWRFSRPLWPRLKIPLACVSWSTKWLQSIPGN